MQTIIAGLMIPFLGTSVGAMCVIFMKRKIGIRAQCAMKGFAAGVMLAASIWSLIVPAIEQSNALGKFAFMPAVAGIWFGILFLWFVDSMTFTVHRAHIAKQRKNSRVSRTAMLVFAIVIHNIPEGMAVGLVYTGWLNGTTGITAMGALILSVGIGIQNIPEGTIISMPLFAQGMSRGKACICGILSGVVEPMAGGITILLSALMIPTMPYLLSFAAGAMLYVVVELIPDMTEESGSGIGTLLFALGFSLMLGLDVALG